MKENTVKFYKLPIVQIYGFLALIPLIFASFSLVKSNRLEDYIIFGIGTVFIFSILLVNAFEPVVVVKKDRVILNNTFNNRPLNLLKADFTGYSMISRNVVTVNFKDKSYQIKLSRKSIIKFIKILEEFS